MYSARALGPLGLTGTLTLDGENNADSVFIFQTASTLVTAPSSSGEMINGALECNVFWQVGSSATLDVNSSFVGTILALTSITVNTNVVVHGRALARNGSVTLDSDLFSAPGCTSEEGSTTTSGGGGGGGTTTTSGGGAGGTTTTLGEGGGGTTTTLGEGGGAGVTTTLGGGGGSGVTTTLGGGGGSGVTTTLRGGGTAGVTTTRGAGATVTTVPGGVTTTMAGVPAGPGVPGVVGPPRTGAEPPAGPGFPWLAAVVAFLLCSVGTMSVFRVRPLPAHNGR